MGSFRRPRDRTYIHSKCSLCKHGPLSQAKRLAALHKFKAGHGHVELDHVDEADHEEDASSEQVEEIEQPEDDEEFLEVTFNETVEQCALCTEVGFQVVPHRLGGFRQPKTLVCDRCIDSKSPRRVVCDGKEINKLRGRP